MYLVVTKVGVVVVLIYDQLKLPLDYNTILFDYCIVNKWLRVDEAFMQILKIDIEGNVLKKWILMLCRTYYIQLSYMCSLIKSYV